MHGLTVKKEKRRVAMREAQRRFRKRQKKCQRSYRADANDLVLSMLVRRKYIDEDELEDGREVSAAISLFLADAAKHDDG